MILRRSAGFRARIRFTRVGSVATALGLILLWGATLNAQAITPGSPSNSPTGTSGPGSSPRQIAAVIPLSSSGASPTEVSAATDRLQEELYRIGKFALADRGVVDAAYAKQVAQPGGCVSLDCAIGVGFSLGADQIITGKLTKVDDSHWVLAGQLVDAQSSKTLRASTLQYSGAYFDLSRQAIPYLAARLSGTPPADTRAISAHVTETFTMDQMAPAAAGAPAPTSAPVPGAPPASPPAEPESPTGPKRGFALFTGFTNFNGNFHPKGGNSVAFSGGGFGTLGLEYQWVPSSPITISAYLEAGGGSLQGDLTTYYDTVSASEFGVEVRYWLDPRTFLGGRISSYLIGFSDYKDKGNDPLDLYGTSYGVSGGYESERGWFVKGALDYAQVQSSDTVQVRPDDHSPRVPLSGSGDAYSLWVDVGYRWK